MAVICRHKCVVHPEICVSLSTSMCRRFTVFRNCNGKQFVKVAHMEFEYERYDVWCVALKYFAVSSGHKP